MDVKSNTDPDYAYTTTIVIPNIPSQASVDSGEKLTCTLNLHLRYTLSYTVY